MIEWRPVVGYEEQYIVSNFGNVIRLEGETGIGFHPQKDLTPNWWSYAYPRVGLSNGGGYRHMMVHRLVAEAFIPNPENLPVVNHINGDKLNPNITNLEWVTYSDNAYHAHKTGLHGGVGLLSAEDVQRIRIELVSKDTPVIELATKYEVRPEVIYRLKQGTTYTHSGIRKV